VRSGFQHPKEELIMSNAIIDLLESAKILARASDDRMLGYLIEMALHEAHESKTAGVKAKKAA
jgi:hypothetical protein